MVTLTARDKDRRLEAWLCFLFTLVVAPAADFQGTPQLVWPSLPCGLS